MSRFLLSAAGIPSFSLGSIWIKDVLGRPTVRSSSGVAAVEATLKQTIVEGAPSAVLQSLAFRLRIAVGSDHDDGNVGSQCFGLGQEFKTVRPRHVVADPDLDAVAEILGRGSQNGLVAAFIRFRLTLCRGVEALIRALGGKSR